MGVRELQAEWRRVQIYRRMSGEQRIALAAEMYEDGVISHPGRSKLPAPGREVIEEDVHGQTDH